MVGKTATAVITAVKEEPKIKEDENVVEEGQKLTEEK